MTFTQEIEQHNKLIKDLKAENRLLGERCNQLLKDKGELTDRVKKMRNCGNCNGIIEGGIRTEKCKICMSGKDLSQWELKND